MASSSIGSDIIGILSKYHIFETVGMRLESMIHSMRGVLHLRNLCYIHERDANPLVVTTNLLEYVRNR